MAAEIDVLTAQGAEIQAALTAVQAEVAGQQVVVKPGPDAQAAADAAIAASAEEIAALEAETAALNAAIDQMIIDAFLHPPLDHALDAFEADTVADATVKNGLVDIQADEGAATLERLAEAEEELTVQKADQEVLAAEATQAPVRRRYRPGRARRRAHGPDPARHRSRGPPERQAVRGRRPAGLGRRLSQQIAAEQAALAAALAASQAQPSARRRPSSRRRVGWRPSRARPEGRSPWRGPSPPTSRRCSTPHTPTGSTCAAGATATPPSRSPCARRTAAPPTTPSTRCRRRSAVRRRLAPASMHEQGLAIDFTCNGGGAAEPQLDLLHVAGPHAATYGLFNLPEEPWHWSTNGN